MPAQHLIDLTTIDLETVIATREEILQQIKQRGSFAMLDGILHRSEEDGVVVAYKDIREDDWWAPDHIPGRPIFPGALQIEASGQLSTYDYMLGNDIGGRFLGFGGVNGARFRGVVEPPAKMVFVAKVNRLRKTMFTYFTQGFVDGKLVYEGEIIGVAL